MHSEFAFVALFAVATLVAVVAGRLKIPYTVALVIAGLLLGTTGVIHPPHLTKGLLYAVFLPGLLFEAAFHLDVRKYWQSKWAIHTLAVPGIVVAVVCAGVVLTAVMHVFHLAEGFTVQHGLVLGALLAATDPIAVVALFKRVGAPSRLAMIVEGESLINDGTAVVLFTVILDVSTGGTFSVTAALIDFVRIVGMGMLIGAAFGFGLSKLTQRLDEPMVEIMLTTLAAYGSFLVAEHFHFSGVIATVVAGVICGTYGARTAMTPSTRLAVEAFWEYVGFALNSLVFLLIGFTVHLGTLIAAWPAIVAAFLAVLVGRALVVTASAAALRGTRERMPWSWTTVLTWGGLRGALSMVLALGLPDGFPHREVLITMTFGAVVLSILLQGLTMAPLLRRLGLARTSDARRVYDVHRGSLLAARAALSAIETMRREGDVPQDILSSLEHDYAAKASSAEAKIDGLHEELTAVRENERRATERELLLVEKDALRGAMHRGLVDAHAGEELIREVDRRLLDVDPTRAE